MLVFVGFACDLIVCPILLQKPVGLTKPVGLLCTITQGASWDTYYCQLDMAALLRLGIEYDELLAVRTQQVVPWVVPWVAPTVGLDFVVHGYGGPPAVRA